VREISGSTVYEFGSFRLDPAERLLLKDGQPVPLTPKAFDLLVFLAERSGRLVEKQALMSALWPNAVVEEANLAYNVSALRKALGDGHDGEHIIQTVPTRGYRFIAPVRQRSAVPPPKVPLRPWRFLLAAALATAALVTASELWRSRRPDRPAGPVVRFELATVGYESIAPPAISPDGTRVVYSAREGGQRQLHVRALDSLQTTVLPGTVGVDHPFFSPDGRAIGFATRDNVLMTMDLATRQLTRVCATFDKSDIYETVGAAWGPDGRLYFAGRRGLFAVRAEGGLPERVADIQPGEGAHGWPEVLPGGRHILFSAWKINDIDHARVEALSLDTRERRTLLEDALGARYLASGHLAYIRHSTLFVVPFDPATLRMHGNAVPVLDGVGVGADARTFYGVSATGTLVYHAGSFIQEWTEMFWVSGGAEQPIAAPPGYYSDPKLSPDDRRLAVAPNYGSHQDIWVHDFARGTWARVTTHPGFSTGPLWHPLDANRLVFASARPDRSGSGLFSMPADGSEIPEMLYASPHVIAAASAAPAAGLVAFLDRQLDARPDVWLLDLRGKPAARPLVQTPAWDGSPALSPDGRWFAYESDESGRMEVYVRPIAGPPRKWLISPDGGDKPRWSRDGRRIVYRSGRRIFAVSVVAGASFTADRPQLLYEGPLAWGGSIPNYDITADGRRLLLIKPAAEQPRFPLVVVENWFTEMRQKIGR
jgi:Tol biopolymer transport system component/DNA-binding winged helix-turn-helix (wHTH) protein